MKKLTLEDIRILSDGPQIKRYIEAKYDSVEDFYMSHKFSISLRSLRTYLSRDTVSSETLKCSIVHFLNVDYNDIVLSDNMQISSFVNNIHENIELYKDKNDVLIFDKLIELTEEYRMVRETAILYRAKAKNYSFRNCFNQAVECYEIAIYTLEKFEIDYMVLFYCEIANLYFNENKIALAEQYFEVADEYISCHKLTNEILYKYNYWRGISYLYKDSEHSRNLFEIALGNASSKVEKACAMQNIGLTYKLQHSYDKAIKLYIEAYDFYDNDDYIRKSSIWNNIAVIYINLGKLDDAMEYINKAMDMIDNKKEYRRYIKYLHTKTKIEVLKGNEAAALKYFETIKEFKENYIEKNALIDSMTDIIDIIRSEEILRKAAKLVVHLYI